MKDLQEFESKANDILQKGSSSLLSMISGPALLILISWNIIEFLICAFLGSSAMMWLCGSILDTAVNGVVLLFMVQQRKWYNCWIWAGIIFVFNTIPCLLPLELGHSVIADMMLLCIHIFIICTGDVIGNVAIAVAMRKYPLDIDIRVFIAKLMHKEIDESLQNENTPTSEEETAEPDMYAGGFTQQVPANLDFGGFGGLTAPVDVEDETVVTSAFTQDALDSTSFPTPSSDEEDAGSEGFGGGFGGGF